MMCKAMPRIPLFLIVTAALFSCGEKIQPGAFSEVEKRSFTPSHTATVKVNETDRLYEAVGTVRPKTETRIEARVTGQVLDVLVTSGDAVAKGDLLISLDSRQLKSRMEQAEQALKTAVAGRDQARHAVDAAKAAFKQAKANYDRIQNYFDNQAATAQELERAEAEFRQAESGVRRAEEALAAATAGVLKTRAMVKESAISFDYTRILAPQNAVVLKRFVDPGDLALPGKPLLALRTSSTLRLEAYVREGLIYAIKPGSAFEVEIETVNKVVDSTVEEIVPYADPSSRTFLVKAVLPPMENLFPGMFGKLRIPVGRHRIVTTPRDGVRRVGQLEMVTVKTDDGWQTRHVKTGSRLVGGEIEILSGLNGGETIGWEDADNG